MQEKGQVDERERETPSAKKSAAPWISARVVAGLLSGKLQSSVHAKQVIADYLRDGRLRSRAEKFWTSDEEALRDAWGIPDNYRAKKVVLPKTWRSSDSWVSDVSEWRWWNSCFHVTHHTGSYRTMLYQVKIRREDLIKEFPGIFQRERWSPPQSWIDYLAAASKVILNSETVSEDEIGSTKNGFHNKIIRQVLIDKPHYSSAKSEPLSYSATSKTISAIFEAATTPQSKE